MYTFLEVDSHTLHAIIYHICRLCTHYYKLLMELKYGWCIYSRTKGVPILELKVRFYLCWQNFVGKFCGLFFIVNNVAMYGALLI